MSSDMRDLSNISPIHMNMGRAARAQEWLAPQRMVAMTCPMGADENMAMPAMATRIREKATQTPLASRTSRPISNRAMIIISGIFSSFAIWNGFVAAGPGMA